MPNWETVDVPVGTYIGWGNSRGQHVTGKVTDYDATGATDFDGNPCPYLEIELTEPAASFDKFGERTDYAAGATVMMSCGQVSLKRKIRKAAPRQGDMVKITMADIEKVDRGTVKVFEVQVARGAGGSASSSASTSVAAGNFAAANGSDDPPF